MPLAARQGALAREVDPSCLGARKKCTRSTRPGPTPVGGYLPVVHSPTSCPQAAPRGPSPSVPRCIVGPCVLSCSSSPSSPASSWPRPPRRNPSTAHRLRPHAPGSTGHWPHRTRWSGRSRHPRPRTDRATAASTWADSRAPRWRRRATAWSCTAEIWPCGVWCRSTTATACAPRTSR
jgi:hypothetical protein